jgi:hypothetical protein
MMKSMGMGKASSMHGEKRNAYRFSYVKARRKQNTGKS